MSANQTESAGTGSFGTGSWQDLVREGAREVDTASTGQRLELVTFDLADDHYAISVGQVREIVRLIPITPMPRVPEAVCGVISLRGEIAQVIDLRRCLGMPSAEPTRASRIIVRQGEESGVCGLLVDQVRGVLRIAEEDTLPPPSGDGDFVVALCPRDDQFVSLLDLDRVIAAGIGSLP